MGSRFFWNKRVVATIPPEYRLDAYDFPIEMIRKERRRRARFDVYRIWEDFQRSPLKVPLRWGWGVGSQFFWNKRVVSTILPEYPLYDSYTGSGNLILSGSCDDNF